MKRGKLGKLFGILIIITVSFALTGGDCGTDADDPNPVGGVSAPRDVQLRIDANPGGSSLAVVSWAASTDEGQSEFGGYRVNTYIVDSTGQIQSRFASDLAPKTAKQQVVNSIDRGTRYRTYVSSELNDGTRSDSVATEIYGGVFSSNDGSIDSYTISGPAESGYGWDVDFGVGTQYAYTDANAQMIDVHARDNGTGLKFYSPDLFDPGVKTTKFGVIGTGQTAYDQTTLSEPALDSIPVNDDAVYLLKLESNNYVKIWITAINNIAGANPPYSSIEFNYKVQPIDGLRILKR